MKIITISIAAFNAESYIREALNSIVESKHFDKVQVIIVNDGSIDKTEEVVSEYVNRYPYSIMLINKINGGYGSTINSALKKATGKYFKLLDADDWFCTNEFDKLIEYLSEATADIVISDYHKFYEAFTQYERIKAINTEPNCIFNIETLTDFNLNPAMSIKTEVLRDSSFKITEKCFYTDLEFCARAVLLSNNYVYFPVSVYCYRIGRTGQSISLESRAKHVKDHEYVVQLVAEMILTNIQYEALHEKIFKMLKGHIIYYYFYLKPTLTNLIAFENYCDFINVYAPETRKYLDNESSKAFTKPRVYYLMICARNRSLYRLKKWKNQMFRSDNK